MIETSGVIEKEQGNGFYLVTLEQPAGHQCLCRAAGKLTKFHIKLLAGDKVLVEISPYDLEMMVLKDGALPNLRRSGLRLLADGQTDLRAISKTIDMTYSDE